jgi:uncharacterized protein DUF6335
MVTKTRKVSAKNKKGSKTRKLKAVSQDAGTAERPVYVTDPEVQQELDEAGRVGPHPLNSVASSGVATPPALDPTTDPTAEEEPSGIVPEAVEQNFVDDFGKAIGVTYQDNEVLDPLEKLQKRDRKRWELNPSSAEDFKDRERGR